MIEAERRADLARYQEIQCRSALNAADGMPFRWTLNPYRGCTHGCHYCYARRYHRQFELDAGDDFASVIFVKRNVVEVLRRELDRPSWRRELVAIGTATDAYQPIEGSYRLTRGSLEALVRARTPLSVVTKGPMVVRDIDVLRDAAQGAGGMVYMSLPTVDESPWTALEPGTAHPRKRLRAIEALARAGVPVGVLVAPIVPGFTSAPAQLERTVRAAAEHGAQSIGYNVMHLPPGTREHFLRFVDTDAPEKRAALDRLYAGVYAGRPFRDQVKLVMERLRQRYGLSHRPSLPDAAQGDPATSQGPEQGAFTWDAA